MTSSCCKTLTNFTAEANSCFNICTYPRSCVDAGFNQCKCKRSGGEWSVNDPVILTSRVSTGQEQCQCSYQRRRAPWLSSPSRAVLLNQAPSNLVGACFHAIAMSSLLHREWSISVAESGAGSLAPSPVTAEQCPFLSRWQQICFELSFAPPAALRVPGCRQRNGTQHARAFPSNFPAPDKAPQSSAPAGCSSQQAASALAIMLASNPGFCLDSQHEARAPMRTGCPSHMSQLSCLTENLRYNSLFVHGISQTSRFKQLCAINRSNLIGQLGRTQILRISYWGLFGTSHGPANSNLTGRNFESTSIRAIAGPRSRSPCTSPNSHGRRQDRHFPRLQGLRRRLCTCPETRAWSCQVRCATISKCLLGREVGKTIYLLFFFCFNA
jgi:hypothetical protein